MANFNKLEFGENLKKYRKANGLSQDNLARLLNLDRTMISKYEKGVVIPSLDKIELICNELGITETDLYNSNRKIQNIKNSNNPFNTNTLYLFYIAYSPQKDKFVKGKFVLKLYDKDSMCKIDFYDYKDKTLSKKYLSGYLLSDSQMATFILENNEEYSRRLEVVHLILNIARGTKGLLKGSMQCTNGDYIPSSRKIRISEKDIVFTDELFEELKFTEKEINSMKEKGVLYIENLGTYDFEK